jgi:hypothetical protein
MGANERSLTKSGVYQKRLVPIPELSLTGIKELRRSSFPARARPSSDLRGPLLPNELASSLGVRTAPDQPLLVPGSRIEGTCASSVLGNQRIPVPLPMPRRVPRAPPIDYQKSVTVAACATPSGRVTTTIRTKPAIDAHELISRRRNSSPLAPFACSSTGASPLAPHAFRSAQLQHDAVDEMILHEHSLTSFPSRRLPPLSTSGDNSKCSTFFETATATSSLMRWPSRVSGTTSEAVFDASPRSKRNINGDDSDAYEILEWSERAALRTLTLQ